MNTNNVNKLMIVGAGLGMVLSLVLLRYPTNYLSALVAGVGYAAVAGVLAIAAGDYKVRRF